MTLDEAIQHSREKAQKHRQTEKKYREIHRSENDESLFKEQLEDCIGCAREHEQLAEWLEELKDYRRFNGAKTFDNGFKQGEKYGYKKAIDDFADEIVIYETYDGYGNAIHILEIADELKKERAE